MIVLTGTQRLAANVAIFLLTGLGGVAVRAAEMSLAAQTSMGGTPGQPKFQSSVDKSRDALIDSVQHLLEAEAHLAADQASEQAALSMHTNGAAAAFMNVQNINALLGLAASTRSQIQAVLTPPAPEGATLPQVERVDGAIPLGPATNTTPEAGA